jgi:hypothetical protein
VLDLVASARADIASGQAALVLRLDTLLQKQQAALEAAVSAAKALAAIQDLQGQQARALQSLERAVQSQLYAIKVCRRRRWCSLALLPGLASCWSQAVACLGLVCSWTLPVPRTGALEAWCAADQPCCWPVPQVATSQNVITLGQALLVWKRARRDRALSAKVSQLANVPCTMAPTAGNSFLLDNGNNGEPITSCIIDLRGRIRLPPGLCDRLLGARRELEWQQPSCFLWVGPPPSPSAAPVLPCCRNVWHR